jgi:hypothetical protein
MYGLFNRGGAYKQKINNLKKKEKTKMKLSKIFYGLKNKIKKKK